MKRVIVDLSDCFERLAAIPTDRYPWDRDLALLVECLPRAGTPQGASAYFSDLRSVIEYFEQYRDVLLEHLRAQGIVDVDFRASMIGERDCLVEIEHGDTENRDGL